MWIGAIRTDGVRVQQMADGNWLVIGPNNHELDKCPCCNKPLVTTRIAKLVADAWFPTQDNAA